MKIVRRAARRGFTLVELSLAMAMGIMTAAMVLALFNQQAAFLRIYQTQDFLTEEAPIVQAYVTRMLGRADRFRLHQSIDDALAGRNPQLTAAPVLLMNFRQPDGAMRAALLSFENRGAGPRLYFYLVPRTGALGAPQWSVTGELKNAEFFVQQGVLRMTLTGPADEQITYSGTMQL